MSTTSILGSSDIAKGGSLYLLGPMKLSGEHLALHMGSEKRLNQL